MKLKQPRKRRAFDRLFKEMAERLFEEELLKTDFDGRVRLTGAGLASALELGRAVITCRWSQSAAIPLTWQNAKPPPATFYDVVGKLGPIVVGPAGARGKCVRQAVCATHNQIRVSPDHFENYLGIALNASHSGAPTDGNVARS
jgi:hypothetical protein